MNKNPQTWSMSYDHPIRYDMICCDNIFHPESHAIIPENNTFNRRFVVVDDTVYQLYQKQINDYFLKKNIIAKIIPFDAGEVNKSLDNYIALLAELNNFPIDRRNEPIIAIGGGVLTDVVGFVAGTYRRGIPHIKIPTTLIGYVDAAIGVKAGINFLGNKNRVGSFTAPEKILLDKSFLATLKPRYIRDGVGEILKFAVIKDPRLFDLLDKQGVTSINEKFQNTDSDPILNLAIDAMIQELQPNLFEADLARVADFGHTFSVSLEMQQEISILHGEAVTNDILLSSILSWTRGILSREALNKIIQLIRKLNLPIYHRAFKPRSLFDSVIERTNHRGGQQRVPIPSKIGECTFLNDITLDEISNVCNIIKTLEQGVLA